MAVVKRLGEESKKRTPPPEPGRHPTLLYLSEFRPQHRCRSTDVDPWHDLSVSRSFGGRLLNIVTTPFRSSIDTTWARRHRMLATVKPNEYGAIGEGSHQKKSSGTKS